MIMAASKKSAARKQAAPRKAAAKSPPGTDGVASAAADQARPPRPREDGGSNRMGRELASDGRPVHADGLSLVQWREAHKGDPPDVKRETTRFGRPLASDGNPVFTGGLSHAQWKARRRAERARAAVTREPTEDSGDQ